MTPQRGAHRFRILHRARRFLIERALEHLERHCRHRVAVQRVWKCGRPPRERDLGAEERDVLIAARVQSSHALYSVSATTGSSTSASSPVSRMYRSAASANAVTPSSENPGSKSVPSM